MSSLSFGAGANIDNTHSAPVDTAKAEQIATSVCIACHGVNGNSTIMTNPKLAGQHVEYLYKQLKAFKAASDKPAERTNAVMNGMVASLSDEDMRSLATYYSQQKLQPDAAKNKQTIELGRKLYRGGNISKGLPACAACHGPTGAGLPVQYPHIAGQFAEYTKIQLKAFRAEERTNDPNGMMRAIALKMTDKEIEAVADYIAGLR